MPPLNLPLDYCKCRKILTANPKCPVLSHRKAAR